MPRAPRCSYYINDRRCSRNGKGNPPLCDRCRDVAEGKPGAASGGAVGDLIASMLGGERVSREQIKRAAEEVIGTFRAQRVNVAPPAPRGPMFDNPPAPRHHPPPPPPPPPHQDSEAAMRARVVAAMKTLGLKPSTKLTIDLLNQRRRDLAKRYHPDKAGGSVVKMQEVNAAVDFLLALMES